MFDNKIRSICLGSYIPWDTIAQSRMISEELGWKGDQVEGVPSRYNYEKIECSVQGVRDYLKYIKRGYGRTTHLTSIDVRNGRMNREEAMGLIADYVGKEPASLERFLKYVNLSKQEFNEIAVNQKVHPYEHEFNSKPKGEPLPDEDLYK